MLRERSSGISGKQSRDRNNVCHLLEFEMLTQHLKPFIQIILTSEIYTGRMVKLIMSPWWFNTTDSARKLHLILSPSPSILTESHNSAFS